MRYPLPIPGMEGHVIEVTAVPLLQPPNLLIDDLQAPTGVRKGEFLIYRPDGKTDIVLLTGQIFDVVPEARLNGRTVALAPPLQWQEWLLIALPLCLVFVGLTGAVFGSLAAIANVLLLRSSRPESVRNLGALGVACAAFVVGLLLAILMLREHPPIRRHGTAAPPPAHRRGLFHLHPFFHPHPKPAPVPVAPTPDTNGGEATPAPTATP